MFKQHDAFVKRKYSPSMCNELEAKNMRSGSVVKVYLKVAYDFVEVKCELIQFILLEI